MSIKNLKWQIDQQVTQLDSDRKQIKNGAQRIRKAVASPAVLCGGLVVGFLIGYFLMAGKKNFLANNLGSVFSSPLFLLATTLLKSD